MSVSSITSFGAGAKTDVLATHARENAAVEGSNSAAGTESLTPCVGATSQKVGESLSPSYEFFDLSNYKKGVPIPPHSIRG